MSGKKKSVKEKIKKMYPQTYAEFEKIQEEQKILFCQKQLDYGPGNISVGTQLKTQEERDFSLQGLWYRINDKVQRILNLTLYKSNPQNESIEDSLLDIGNYSIIGLIVRREKWGK
tara:strand:+ start:1202 stop:1549 length:348 start_codon:yes stop_codon:yes gene_type:complete